MAREYPAASGGDLSREGWQGKECLSTEQGRLSSLRLAGGRGSQAQGIPPCRSRAASPGQHRHRHRARERRQHFWHHPKLPPVVWEQPGLELPGALQGCCPRMQRRSVLSEWLLSSAWSPSASVTPQNTVLKNHFSCPRAQPCPVLSQGQSRPFPQPVLVADRGREQSQASPRARESSLAQARHLPSCSETLCVRSGPHGKHPAGAREADKIDLRCYI